MSRSPLRVIVLTPFGQHGRGGMDRLMDSLRPYVAAEPDLEVEFVRSRGHDRLLSPIVTLGALARVFAACLRGRVDLLHLNLAPRGSTFRKGLFAWCARLFGIPYVLHVHGSSFDQFWDTQKGVPERIVDDLFLRAARIIVLGSMWKRLVVAHVPSVADRVVLLPNATAPFDAARRIPHAGVTTRILFLGLIGERKGVPTLVEALGLMGDEPGWTAVIAGDGAVEEMRRRIGALGLADRVAFPGWVGGPDVEKLLAEADVLVLPSLQENLPMSVIEGMAAGVAVVCTPAGAVPDIVVHDESGLLVPFSDPPALADAFRRLVRSPELRDRLGAAARRYHQENLEISVYVRRLFGLWRAAARSR